MIPEQLQLIKIKAEAAQLSGVMLVIEPAAVLAMVAEVERLRAFSAKATLKFADASSRAERLEIRIEQLESSIAKIEQRWREASKDTCFRQHYRGTMAECANELAAVLAGVDDSELEAEIDKAVEGGGL